MEKRKDKLLFLSHKYPEVNENYNLLVTYYWREYENANSFSDVSKCTSSESITRAFRELVKEGVIKLPDGVKNNRRKREKEYRDYYSSVN